MRNKNQTAHPASSNTVLLVLGNQLFEPKLIKANLGKSPLPSVYLREDSELCTYFTFHKHKIIFFLAAMRTYAEELRKAGFVVHYETLKPSSEPYERHFLKFLDREKASHVITFEIEDKFFESRIQSAVSAKGLSLQTWQSPMFLSSREDFKSYLGKSKKPFMKNFYERQRKQLAVLVNPDLTPVGGKWSFDTENRKALPTKVKPPPLPLVKESDSIREVQALCDSFFSKHPGESQNFWLPVDRQAARKWLVSFIEERLTEFGPYEDAIASHSDFVFHSVLTPFLNTGLLTPKEVVDTTLSLAPQHKVPLQSLEGFLRQVIGWREFIRGIYQNFSQRQSSMNFWKHQRKLTSHWYEANTGVPPLDQTIKKVLHYGYAHHIERLMVVGSLMVLLEVDPQEAYRWFMEMFIDSSDWVMGPNVFGMALFSDGGIFATKPYLCGSNYYCKMGGFKKDSWCDAVDGLYWRFIEKHSDFFLKNPRLSMMARTVQKMDPKRKLHIFHAAEALQSRLTK